MYGEHPNGGMTEIDSRDVDFLEEDFPKIGEIKVDLNLYELVDSSDNPSSSQIQDKELSIVPYIVGNSGSSSLQDELGMSDNPENLGFRRSARGNVPRRHFEIEGEFLVNLARVDPQEPTTYAEALASPDSRKWLEAMQEEIDSMAKNHVWELIDLPPGRKPVGNKWIFKIKRKSDGSIDKFKARLVAKGYTQQEGVDYEETFSPVVRFASLRLILAIVAHLDLDLFQMDVKTAFLNGELDEEIYMDQPEGFQIKKESHKVCRLKRSIYGLKQSSRQWYIRFQETILTLGFSMIDDDHCVYVKRIENKILILTLYVDDILLAGNDMEMINATRDILSSIFEMKDLGPAEFILGVQVIRDRSKRFLALSQETYIRNILERFRMHNSKSVDTPIQKGFVLSADQCPTTREERERMSNVPYASAVGSLMYAMLCTRPDLAHAVSVVSRYQSNPGSAHWTAVKRIFRYLQGTTDLALCYHGGNLQLYGFADADGSTDRDGRNPMSAYAFFLGGGTISWRSKKVDLVSLSMMESEFVACTAAVQEAIWLRRFLGSLNVTKHADKAVTIYCDNTAAIAYAKNPKYHGRTKHIDTQLHFIRDHIAKGNVILEYIPTGDMVANPLTKPITTDSFRRHVNFLGLKRI